jgi:protein-tyrosine kinase
VSSAESGGSRADASLREFPSALPFQPATKLARQFDLAQDVDGVVTDFWTGKAGTQIGSHFRGLRRELLTRLQPVKERGAAPLVLITSPLPGDGKTFVSTALARTFANAPENIVTLLDFDLIRRSSSLLFGAAGARGLMDCLRGEARIDQVVSTTDAPRMNFVPAGEREGDGDAREAFLGQSLGDVLQQLRQLGPNNICFLDAPPVLPVVETALLANKVDLILLVVRAGVTPQAAVLDALAKLGAHAKLAVVLNGVVHAHTGEYYDYSYYGRN